MLVRIVVIAALFGVGLFVAKEERVFEKTGIVGHCEVVPAPAGHTGQWQGCHEGLMTGYPNLFQDSCTRESRRGAVEYWRCATPRARG